MLKFVWEEEMRRGMASPRVALATWIFVSRSVIAEQAPSSKLVQVEPVKPLIQIQEQEPVDKEAIPPFLHDVLVSFWHCCSGVREAMSLFFLITRK